MLSQHLDSLCVFGDEAAFVPASVPLVATPGGLLGDELYERFVSYVTDLRMGAARGRMVSEILDDASTMKEFEAEVAQFCKDYEPLKFSKDEKNLIKLTAFFDAKLPRESHVP